MAILTFLEDVFPDLPFVLFGLFWLTMFHEAIRMWIDAGSEEESYDEDEEDYYGKN